ncbi:MAG: branched-chain amino acid transport system permease protein [Candidatus Aldehydirespiratoraceae bacterium]|jgi:branched-chain amino acid transport system permease protein
MTANLDSKSPELAPSRSLIGQDWKKVIRFGLLLALASVFISLIGMPVKLDSRIVVEPYISMGYLSLLWMPVILGYVVSSEKVLEGMAVHAKGGREVGAGLLVGLIGGAFLALLVWGLDTRDLKDPLVNWGDNLLNLLTFNESVGYGALVWLSISAGLGLVGGLLHVIPRPAMRAVLAAVIAVFLTVALESALDDISEGFRLEWLFEWLFERRGGLSPKGAVVVMVVAAAYSLFGRERTAVVKGRYEKLEGEERTKANGVLLIVLAVSVVVLPMFLGKLTNELLANVGLFLLLALGLNIVVGLAGILDLGYVAFFAVGGYTTAILTSPNSPGISPELPWLVALIIVVIMAGGAGLFIGAPVIRMRGDYLAIVTLGFGEIIRLTVRSDWASGLTGGAQGITGIPGAQIFGLAEVRGINPQAVFYLVAFFCAIAIYVSWRLERSRLGRAWMAVREDESVAEAMGINTVNVKLMAFVVGAVLAAFSGAIFAAKVGSVFESSFKILVSIVILVVVIVGGMGRIAGVIAGAFVLIGVLGGPNQPGLLAEFSEFKLLIYGALLVWMMLTRPEGLIPNARRSRELHQDEFLQDAWLKGEIDDDDGSAVEGEVAPA